MHVEAQKEVCSYAAFFLGGGGPALAQKPKSINCHGTYGFRLIMIFLVIWSENA